MGWFKDDRIKDEPQREKRRQAAILAACLFGHVLVGIWLVRERPVPGSDDVRLEISFIPRASAPTVVIPPPLFPTVPQRPTRPQPATRPRAMLSAPPDGPAQRIQSLPAELLHAPPSTARLLDAAEAAARVDVGTAMPAPRDPTRRYAPRLAGREEPYTPEAYVLRKEVTPEDVVNAIGGMLFGGQVDPCPDTRSRINDLVARNDPRGEDELRVLIDRERRRCR